MSDPATGPRVGAPAASKAFVADRKFFHRCIFKFTQWTTQRTVRRAGTPVAICPPSTAPPKTKNATPPCIPTVFKGIVPLARVYMPSKYARMGSTTRTPPVYYLIKTQLEPAPAPTPLTAAQIAAIPEAQRTAAPKTQYPASVGETPTPAELTVGASDVFVAVFSLPVSMVSIARDDVTQTPLKPSTIKTGIIEPGDADYAEARAAWETAVMRLKPVAFFPPPARAPGK